MKRMIGLLLIGAVLAASVVPVRAQAPGAPPAGGAATGSPAGSQSPANSQPTAPLRAPSVQAPGTQAPGPQGPSAPSQVPGIDGQRTQETGKPDVEQGKPAVAPAPTASEAPFSPIELAFQGITTPSGESLRAIRQFGYSFFRSPVSTFAPVDDVPVGPDYILGPGDALTINVWGSSLADGNIVQTVGRNGEIVLPKVGAIRVWGLSFSEADRLIREHLSRYLTGFNTSVSLGRLRTIRITVVGEVRQPGTYTIGSLATLTNALVAAGGPSATGSLREIRLLRNSHVVGTLDFYDYLLRGDRRGDFRLESGDTIFIPQAGPVAGVTGEVQRPAIYELKGPTPVSEVLQLAGGVMPRAYLKRVQIVRAQPSAERAAIDVDLTRFYDGGDKSVDVMVGNGDLVRVFTSDPRIYNIVNLDGSVKYPGEYAARPGMRISQLLPPDAVLSEAYLERIEIARRNTDRTVQTITVNLRQAWAGDPSQDVALVPQDRINVPVDPREAGGLKFATVKLNGEFRRPGQYTIALGETLSSAIRRAGGFTDRAYLKGSIFTRESLRRLEQAQLQTFLKVQEERLVAEAGTPVIGSRDPSPVQVLEARRQLLQALAARVSVGRVVVRLDQPDRLEGTADDMVLEDGDELTVSQVPGSVLVLGAVRTSTSVGYRPGADVDYYLTRVGGLSTHADKREIHVIKADGSAVADFSKFRTVEPGDTVVVPPKQEEKYAILPTVRDVVGTLGSTLLAIAALALLF